MDATAAIIDAASRLASDVATAAAPTVLAPEAELFYARCVWWYYPPMQVDLKGKVALVTGAARGIGLAIADKLAANGATVVYSDVDFEAVKQTAARTPGAAAVALDVTSEEQVDAAVKQVVSDHGSLDILINNAGVNTLKYRVPIDQFPKSEWDRLLSVDLTGVYLVSRAGANAMLSGGRGGRIINIASVIGLVPFRLQCAFNAAKAGVVHLSKAMALELSPRGILVNCVAPGSILTDGTRKLFYGDDGVFKDSVRQLLAHIPMGRPGEVDEVANVVLFLAAPESSYVNGTVFTVDGGWTAGYARDF